MSENKHTLPKQEEEALKKAYASVVNGTEKLWLSGNTGDPFDFDRDLGRFEAGLKSKAVQQLEDSLDSIYGRE